MDTMEEMVDFLIQNADPEGPNYKKLIKIRDQVARNIMIGPSARAFIRKCISKFDNIGCVHINRSGRCMKIKGAPICRYKSRYSECAKYAQEKNIIKGSPIKLGG